MFYDLRFVVQFREDSLGHFISIIYEKYTPDNMYLV